MPILFTVYLKLEFAPPVCYLATLPGGQNFSLVKNLWVWSGSIMGSQGCHHLFLSPLISFLASPALLSRPTASHPGPGRLSSPNTPTVTVRTALSIRALTPAPFAEPTQTPLQHRPPPPASFLGVSPPTQKPLPSPLQLRRLPGLARGSKTRRLVTRVTWQFISWQLSWEQEASPCELWEAKQN